MKTLGWRTILLALLLCGAAQAEVEIPPLKQRITDLTATLDAGQVQALDARLAAFEASKGSQIAVLILPSTQPEAIEQFGIRVVETWKLGRKGVDDGVLLLIAKDDRKLRIEVGYGLEGALNDATAKRIVSEVISPYFKRGEFYAGVDAGLTAIIKVVAGETLPEPAPQASVHFSGDGMSSLQVLFAAGIFVLLIGNIVLRQFVGKLPSGMIVAGVIGAMAWVLLASLVLAGICALLAFVLSLLFGGGGGNASGFSGWGGGGSMGSWGGESSGGSDFGGGGGDFGGGGASGDW